MKIYQTGDYSRFKPYPTNRTVRRDEGLKKSMSEHGWIDAYPMHVVKNGEGKYQIKAGHHRFEIAKELGIPVKYVVCNDTATISDLEVGPGKWGTANFFDSFCRRQEPDYLYAKRFHLDTGIPIGACICMLAGQGPNSLTNFVGKVKSGKYRISEDISKANIVGHIVKSLKMIGVKHATNINFVNAIYLCIFVEGFDVEEFLKKASTHTYMLENCRSRDEHLDAIEATYNRVRKNKIPLKFLALEGASNRQKTFGRKN